jgi:CheY-like chemotaxis protein
MRVLIVDDDPSTCENLSIGLRVFGGHEVIATQNVASGIEIARSQRFHAGFIDLRFPEGSGIEALRTFVLAQPHAYAFLMSAHQQPEEVVEALTLGAVFVPKWLDVEHLAQLLSHAQTVRPLEADASPDEDFRTRGLRSGQRSAEEDWAELIISGVQSAEDPRTLQIWCRAAGVSRTVLEERHAQAGIKAYDGKCLVRLLWAIRTAQACDGRPIDVLVGDARTAQHILGGFATTNAISLREVLDRQSFVTNPVAVAELARRFKRVFE